MEKNNPLFRTSVKTINILCFSFAFLLVQSCKKGDTGPAGKDGAANVIYSSWFTPDVYVKDTVLSVWGFKYNKSAPDITQGMLDSGTIITYGKLLGYNPVLWPVQQVAPLPINLTYISVGLNNDTWTATATPGNLKIRFVNDKNTYNSISNAHQFRYIVIPPGKKATLSVRHTGDGPFIESKPITDLSIDRIRKEHGKLSYSEICSLLNIPE